MPTEDKDDELFERLAKRWPDLMEKADQQYFGVGAGWFNIVDTLCGVMSRRVAEARYELKYALENEGNKYAMTIPAAEAALATAIEDLPVIQQIKEKFGGLRFYVNRGGDDVSNYISFAEQMSYKTCEICGHPGERRNTGWVKTLCNHHHNELLGRREG
jgi:hypothetical protein